jgi:hypothetical protein
MNTSVAQRFVPSKDKVDLGGKFKVSAFTGQRHGGSLCFPRSTPPAVANGEKRAGLGRKFGLSVVVHLVAESDGAIEGRARLG